MALLIMWYTCIAHLSNIWWETVNSQYTNNYFVCVNNCCCCSSRETYTETQLTKCSYHCLLKVRMWDYSIDTNSINSCIFLLNLAISVTQKHKHYLYTCICCYHLYDVMLNSKMYYYYCYHYWSCIIVI
jgi:hypothetical protein